MTYEDILNKIREYLRTAGRKNDLLNETIQVSARALSPAEAIGNPELINDPRFNTNENRLKNVEALDAIVGKWFKMNTLSEILEVLKENEVPVGPVMDIRDIIKTLGRNYSLSQLKKTDRI